MLERVPSKLGALKSSWSKETWSLGGGGCHEMVSGGGWWASSFGGRQG